MNMSIAFTDFFQRLSKVTNIRTQMDLANALGLNRSAITQAKIRDAVPPKWILALARKYTLSPDWLEFGTGEARPKGKNTAVSPLKAEEHMPGGLLPRQRNRHRLEESISDISRSSVAGELFYVPKSAARLCAGGGSYEVDAEPVARYPLPRSWLTGLGSPDTMVFMDVVGDSMEPAISDGDMVLIDTNNKRYTPASIMAVGYEDAIYLKRLLPEGQGLVMHSDNPAYGPVALYEDELRSFHIIGKLVWLCRWYG